MGIEPSPRATAEATMVLSLMVSNTGSSGPCRKERGGILVMASSTETT